MKSFSGNFRGREYLILLLTIGVSPVWAGSHTWDVQELYSNASGTIQFIELFEANGTAGETGLGGHNITSNTRTVTIPANVASPTTNKRYLIATPGFAALPGAPTPNLVIPAGSVPFFSTSGDSVSYVPWDTTTFGLGQLPTDGLRSFFKGGSTGPATPTNYAGQTFAPPGTSNLLVEKAPGFPDGSQLSLSWNAGTCLGGTRYHIVYGYGSQFPASPGGVLNLQPAGPGQCALTASPAAWNAVPDPGVDPTGLMWILIVADNGSTVEGPWGRDSSGAERIGPAAGGSSGQCGATTKTLTNTCGQ